MAFRFSLATVLRFRESIEKREELMLQQILQEMAGIRRQIEHLAAEITTAQEMRNEAMLRPLPAFHLQAMVDDLNTAGDRKKALIESLAAIDHQRAAQTKKYQAAHRDRQMLTDMLTRQQDAYEQERARTQQKFLDDIFATRSRRS
jgi:flagellar FliJ protein